MIARFKIPQLIMAVPPDGRVKKPLELVFDVYLVNIDYQKEEDHILYVANNLYSIKLIKDEDTVLFTAGFRTMVKHASNLIEIHNVRELRELHWQSRTRVKNRVRCARMNSKPIAIFGFSCLLSEVGVCCVSSHHSVAIEIVCDFSYRVFHYSYPTVSRLIELW
jgi:hypothetical protein